MTAEVLDAAHDLMRRFARLQVCDALHAAVCQTLPARAFCSFDRDFDGLPGVRRGAPDALPR